MQGDAAFGKGEFAQLLHQFGISWRPVPPHRHLKNVFESKHTTICSIFLRLTHDEYQSLSPAIAAQKPIKISHDICGSDIFSAFEMAKEFTRPLMEEPRMIPSKVLDA